MALLWDEDTPDGLQKKFSTYALLSLRGDETRPLIARFIILKKKSILWATLLVEYNIIQFLLKLHRVDLKAVLAASG